MQVRGVGSKKERSSFIAGKFCRNQALSETARKFIITISFSSHSTIHLVDRTFPVNPFVLCSAVICFRF